MYETLRYSVENGVARIVLNRPQVLNAINSVMERELVAVLDEVENDPAALVIVFSGEGKAFSAGYDLKETATNPVTGLETWRRRLEAHLAQMLRIWDCGKPSIAAVHGYALGGGCDLALICDLTYASRDAFFGEPELRFGSGVVTQIIPWVIGMKKSKELLLTGHDRLPAAKAAEMGLVNEAVDGDVVAHALGVAREIAKIDPASLRLTKTSINRRYEIAGVRESLRYNLELTAMIESSESPERVEFDRLRKVEGLKAAIAWRDGRFRS